jgi:hypothetical protein
MRMHMTKPRAEKGKTGAGLPMMCSSRIWRLVCQRVGERVKQGQAPMSSKTPRLLRMRPVFPCCSNAKQCAERNVPSQTVADGQTAIGTT